MSYSTEYKIELIENDFVVEQSEMIDKMQLHDQATIRNKDDYKIATILKVPGGYLYTFYPCNVPVFVPESKQLKIIKK